MRRAAKLEWTAKYQDLENPASGGLLRRVRRKVERPRLVFLLEPPWDATTLAACFAKTSTVGGESRIEGTTLPAPAVAPMPYPLAFIADDPNHKSIYFVMAVPALTLAEAVDLSLDGIAGLPLVFDPIEAIKTTDAGYPYTPTVPYYQVCRWSNVTLVS